MDFQIITNNPRVRDHYQGRFGVHYEELAYKALLQKVRDMVQSGYRLLSHPLSGSVKPNETPYKSVMVSKDHGMTDAESVRIIEECIAACEKFAELDRVWTDDVLDDFRMIDDTLIESAVVSACQADRVM